ncbi:MAG: STAS domain-containing protein [Gammaproteobacteria bacterium]|nr:MAG: STAS domain-containing protein [Gammaproteobacteria bacterium]
MSDNKNAHLEHILTTYHAELLESWVPDLIGRLTRRDKRAENELHQQAAQFLPLLASTLKKTSLENINDPGWDDVRHLLSDMSQARARQGFSPIETANFVFSLKNPLFNYLRLALNDDPAQLSELVSSTGTLFDNLGLYTIEAYQKTRELIIQRQQQELLELSTPVVQLWKNILALPLIGTLDSARTQVVMENLLQKIVDTGALIAIIDITGVPTVDTLVAQHLLKTIAAARLMGADCIISGIRPQIAQTIVHLGVNLEDVITKATLADAFVIALQRTGSNVNQIDNER